MRPLATRALRDETSRQRREIEGIADVQRLLLPDNPAIRGLGLRGALAAGRNRGRRLLRSHVAGRRSRPTISSTTAPTIWAIMLADVSGHGAAAAMEAVQFDAILRTYQGDGDGPAGALTYANRYFFSRRNRQHF